MRDDIHKQVPRPYWVQEWVRRAVNDADREHGRSLDALNDSIRTTCVKEISDEFRLGLTRALESPGLFGPLGNIATPRDLGSKGGHLEAEVLAEAKRLLAKGCSREMAAATALAGVLEARVQADLRAAAPVLLNTRDRQAWLIVRHMQADTNAVDCGEHARAYFESAQKPTAVRTKPTLSADEDLRGRAAGGAR